MAMGAPASLSVNVAHPVQGLGSVLGAIVHQIRQHHVSAAQPVLFAGSRGGSGRQRERPMHEESTRRSDSDGHGGYRNLFRS